MDSLSLKTIGTIAEPVMKNLFSYKAPGKEKAQDAESDKKKMRQKTFLYFVVSLVVLVAYAVLFFSPNLDRLLYANEELNQLQHKTADYRKNRLPEL